MTWTSWTMIELLAPDQTLLVRTFIKWVKCKNICLLASKAIGAATAGSWTKKDVEGKKPTFCHIPPKMFADF